LSLSEFGEMFLARKSR
jgi:DNA-binding MarR family transcriptional regulator